MSLALQKLPPVKRPVPAGHIRNHEDPLEDGVSPLFAGDVRLIRWGNSSASGMTGTFALVDDSPFQVHPLKGLRCATDGERMNGQRLHVVLVSPESEIQDSLALYRGDGILLWWADDCRHGMKFTFRFREGPDGAGQVHPCDGMSAGARNGEVLQLALWAIEDDESLADPRAKRSRRRFHELSATQQAHILCRDEHFAAWLHGRLVDMFTADERVQLARLLDDPQRFSDLCIKRWCGIESKAEFGREGEAAEQARERWQQLLTAYVDDKWRR